MPTHVAAPLVLRLDKIIESIHIDGNSGALVRDLVALTNQLASSPVDIVIFNSGSNDLCLRSSIPEKVAENLVSIGDFIKEAYKVKLVVYCGAIYREKCKDVTPDEFASKVRRFNKKLHELCVEPGRKYFSFKGFWNEDGGIMPVRRW